MPEAVLILIRSVLSFVVLLALTRIMGKQQLSQLTFFDYIVGITIGSIAASMSVDQNIQISNGFVALVIWGFFPVAMAWVSYKSYKFRRFTDGKPQILVKNGRVQDESLRSSMMSVDELMLLLREKNVFNLSDVEFAVMETNGDLSVMKKTETQPVTPKVLGMSAKPEGQPQIVIIDGKLIESSLNHTRLTRKKLLEEVKRQGASGFEDVFVAQVDSRGNVYVDLYDDGGSQPLEEAQPPMEAKLKKMKSDFEARALKAKDEKEKVSFREQASRLENMVKELEPYLK
ncbi:MAG TPA: DUF421 domain-containing protein [Bacillales bacterium]|nr:DUF421 domain-containing protein [Bacillales bacterium]